MEKIETIIKELIGMEVTDEFENDVICAFGETDERVIVSKDESNSNIDYQAYEDKPDTPIICIQLENNKVKDAWEA